MKKHATFTGIILVGVVLSAMACKAQWYQFPRIVSEQLLRVATIDSNVFVSVGSDGVVLRTTNGGMEWTIHQTEKLVSLTDVKRTPWNTLLAVGTTTVQESLDTGKTWQDIVVTVSPDKSMFNGLVRCYPVSDSVIWACGANGIFKSNDRGRNWMTVSLPTAVAIRGLSWPTDSIVFAAGQQGTILRSRDAGATWEKIGRGVSTSHFNDVYFINKDSGVVVGGHYEGVVLATTDGGNTWRIVLEQKWPPVIMASYSGKMWWVSHENRLARTENIFEPVWTDNVLNMPIGSIAWYGEGRGMAASPSSYMFKISNHGVTSTVSAPDIVVSETLPPSFVYFDILGREVTSDSKGDNHTPQYEQRERLHDFQ